MKYKQKFTPVRFSHLTSYASVGAITRDINDILIVITDSRYWTDKLNNVSAEVIPYVFRVTKALGIDKELRMPPKAKELENGEVEGNYLPAVLFPTYAVCKKCGLLHNNPWRKKQVDFSERINCEQCNGNLEQVTWCAVNSEGNLDDVPWHYICHKNSNSTCKVDYDNNYLKITSDKRGKKIVRCTKNGCNSQNVFENIKFGAIYKQQPWIYKNPPKTEKDSVEILEVNNPGVYLPKRENALVIPPESRISKNSVVDRLLNNSKLCREIENIKHPIRKKGKIRLLATEYRCSNKEIEEALERIKDGYPNIENLTVGDLLEDEFDAFLTPIDNVRDDEDFVTEHNKIQWENLRNDFSGDVLSIIKIVDNLVVAKRLREIQIFKGFNRVTDIDNSINLVPPDIDGKSDWLPAIELFGEGLFFTIDEEILGDWEVIPSVQLRASEIATRYEMSEVSIHKDIVVSPRFILLHTLSHLLIRELETTAGYPAASLKERLYCSRDRKMAGILIYTVVADIVGSLGGIVESAEPRAFLTLLDGVFKHAQWCSLDPVCTEHEGQGPGWLNRAACHACALIPEPSCDYGNVFLDRVFIKGSEDLGIPNLLEYIENRSCHTHK
jgi:hypothetical protein